MALRLCSYVAIWRVAMWLCGYVSMWLCGHVAMWLCGYYFHLREPPPPLNIPIPTPAPAHPLGDTSVSQCLSVFGHIPSETSHWNNRRRHLWHSWHSTRWLVCGFPMFSPYLSFPSFGVQFVLHASCCSAQDAIMLDGL